MKRRGGALDCYALEGEVLQGLRWVMKDGRRHVHGLVLGCRSGRYSRVGSGHAPQPAMGGWIWWKGERWGCSEQLLDGGREEKIDL